MLHQRLNDKGHQLEFDSSFSEVLGYGTLSYRLPAGRFLSLDPAAT